MKKLLLLYAVTAMAFTACKRQHDVLETKEDLRQSDSFTKYSILKGQQFCDISVFTPVSYAKMKFEVIFDSSCIYKTLDPANQYDINKLYGFSDNDAHHHQFSAIFGWRFSDDSLRLFGYVYNNSERVSEEICAVSPGQ